LPIDILQELKVIYPNAVIEEQKTMVLFPVGYPYFPASHASTGFKGDSGGTARIFDFISIQLACLLMVVCKTIH
jgi:hypothetical protein